jgi:hypothetical protein
VREACLRVKLGNANCQTWIHNVIVTNVTVTCLQWSTTRLPHLELMDRWFSLDVDVDDPTTSMNLNSYLCWTKFLWRLGDSINTWRWPAVDEPDQHLTSESCVDTCLSAAAGPLIKSARTRSSYLRCAFLCVLGSVYARLPVFLSLRLKVVEDGRKSQGGAIATLGGHMSHIASVAFLHDRR